MLKFVQVPKSYWAAIYRKWQIRVVPCAQLTKLYGEVTLC